MIVFESFISLIVFFLLASALAVALYGRFAKSARGPVGMSLPIYGEPTALDEKIELLAQQYEGLGKKTDALNLLSSNFEAFAARVLAVKLAGRSVDIMCYLWRHDVTGRLLLHEVLQAAERGVRVRLLLDDINAQGRDPAHAALAKHENIEIRLFNPGRARSTGLRRGLEMVLRAIFVTRRMHNKCFIVDGRITFIGGRNIGDAYFDAAENSNFRDLDLMLVGPSVEEAARIFDCYWNSAVVLPIHKLALPIRSSDLRVWQDRLASFRNREKISPYLDYVHTKIPFEYFLRAGQSLFEAKDVRLLADPPEKALRRDRHNWLMQELFPLLKKTQKKLALTSPYFVPGRAGAQTLAELAQKGGDVRVLTNSLAATDVSIVHGGYAAYRKSLLKAGVRLFELKPEGGAKHKFPLRLRSLGRASLHTKAFLIDDAIGFIGSFNFDPRSASLNTEMGILFDCPAIAIHMNIIFCEETTGEMSYEVILGRKNKIAWRSIREGKNHYFRREPESSFMRRIVAMLVRWLPAIKSQL